MTDIRVVRDELPPGPTERRHLISIEELTRDDVERLLATARNFENALDRELKKLPTLRGRTSNPLASSRADLTASASLRTRSSMAFFVAA